MPRTVVVLMRDEARRERADELAPLGEPERERVEDRAGAERGDERVDLRHLDEEAVEQADQRGAGEHEQDRQRPGHAVLDLQADRQDVPHDDAEADVEVDAAGHHRHRGGERQQRDDRLVGEDRAEVEVGRKGPRQEQREEDDEQDGQDRQAVDRERAGRSACQRDRPASSERVGSSALDLMDCMAAACSATIRVRRRAADAGRSRGKQVLDRQVGGAELGDDPAAVEDQRAVADLGDLLEIGRDDDDRGAAPAAPRRTGGRSRPWRRRRRRRSGPRRCRPCWPDAASGRRPPSAGCRPREARSAGSDRSAASPTSRRARARPRFSRPGAR